MKLNDAVTAAHCSASEDAVLAQILETYLAALEAGQAPAREALLAAHPQLADRIERCLESLRFVQGAAAGMAAPHASGLGGQSLAGELGDFRLLREIGRGGMGVVYEAEQISLSRRVALKVLPFAAVLDERQLRRFKNEALAAATLDHPHIVDVHGVGCERGVHFYVMRLVDGATLADVLSHERRAAAPHDAETLPVAELATLRTERPAEFFRRVAELGVQAADALEHAHQLGVVHRDIKPSNLLLDRGAKLWITDFGLAQVESHATLTMPGDVLGTLRYMSPEQAAGCPTMIDHRTDLYSLGATLYELATDRPVVRAQERADALREIADCDPVRPRALQPAMPLDLETILLKCLAKEPAARYDTAQALADDLRRFLEHKPVVARRPTTLERAIRWSRRHFDRLASAGLGILAALSLAVLLLAFEQGKTRRANTELVNEQSRTRAALATAERLREDAVRRAELTLRAVEYARRRQQAIYQVHLLKGTVRTVPGGPEWLAEVVGAEHVDEFDQIQSIHLEPNERGAGLAFLEGLDELMYLHIDGAQGYQVTDDDLAHIGQLKRLQLLLLANVDITDAGLQHLAPLTELQSLRLAYVPITDEGLKNLGLERKRELGSLMLEGTRITDAGMNEIAKCRQLWMLLLDQTAVGDAGLAELKPLDGLRDLTLKLTDVGDAGLAHLVGLSQLRTLYLNNTRVTDAGVARLNALPKLDDIALFNTSVTAAGVDALTRSRPGRRVAYGTSPDEDSSESTTP